MGSESLFLLAVRRRPVAATPCSSLHPCLYEERLARAHERIAALLALEAVEAADIERARNQVRKWADQQICSWWYIHQWTGILAGSPREIASKMLELKKNDAKALFQNTPFGFLVREFLRE